MRRGNKVPPVLFSTILAILYVLLIPIVLQCLSGCSGGDSPCSESNECVAGYACNKEGECIPASDFQITTSALDSAYVGEPYEMQLQASGGISPYQWSVDSGLSWLGVEKKSDVLWVLEGTPDATTPTKGTDVAIISTDNSYGDGKERRKTLPLVVFECVDGRKQNCFTPQGGVCVGGYETCTNNSWGVCDESIGPSIDIENCGPTCEPCDVNTSNSCRGGVCACGEGSPCTGGLICCHHKCMDVPECGDCGDDVRQEWEDCEGTDLGDKNCELIGFASGNLACNEDCTFDTSNCCGDGVVGINEKCDDENTNPTDGCMDCTISDFLINQTSQYGNGASSIAIDSEGNFIVAWQSWDQDGSGTGIFARRLDSNGSPIGNQFLVNTYTDHNQIYPDIGINGAGNFVVIWVSYEQDGHGAGVFGQAYDYEGTTIGSEFQINTQTDGYQYESSIAMRDSGDFVVVWQGPDSTGMYNEIYYQQFDSGGSRVGGELVANATQHRNQHAPSVSMDSMGNFVITWERQDESGIGSNIIARRFNHEGTPQGDEFQVNTTLQESNMETEVAMNGAGVFIVVWECSAGDSSGHGILARLFSSDGAAITGEFQVNSYTTSDQMLPDVSIDDAGSSIIVWSSREQDNGFSGVFGQRYSSGGQPVGNEFQINTHRGGHSGAPSVAMHVLGRFVVSWDSFVPTSNPEVFGQRFNAQGDPRGREAW